MEYLEHKIEELGADEALARLFPPKDDPEVKERETFEKWVEADGRGEDVLDLVPEEMRADLDALLNPDAKTRKAIDRAVKMKQFGEFDFEEGIE